MDPEILIRSKQASPSFIWAQSCTVPTQPFNRMSDRNPRESNCYSNSRSDRSQFSAWVSNQSNELISELQIVVSLFLFGTSFIGQKKAMLNGMKPITYNACRYCVSTLVLWWLKDGLGWKLQISDEDSINNTANSSEKQDNHDRHLSRISTIMRDTRKELELRQLVQYSIILGICNFGGSMLQQIGLVSVTAGKTGFITGMFVVFVPLVEFCFIPKYRANMTGSLVLSVCLSFSGLYFLSGCMESEVCFGGAIKEGEVIVFVSMLFWVMSIIVADYGAKSVEVITLTFYEFLLTTTLTSLSALYFEPHNFVYPFESITSNWALIVLVGITEALAFAFSTLGQMYTPPSRAAILFSMEAVICAILAYLVLNEHLTYNELFGAILMSLAAVISSLFASSEDEEEARQSLQDDLAEFYDAKERQLLSGGGEGDEEDRLINNEVLASNYYQYNPYTSASASASTDYVYHEGMSNNNYHHRHSGSGEPPAIVPRRSSSAKSRVTETGLTSSPLEENSVIIPDDSSAFQREKEEIVGSEHGDGRSEKYYTYRKPSLSK